jgi:thiol-disulfide isomerase/thioredoxin
MSRYKFIILSIFLVSLIFTNELSDEQVDKIKEITSDINKAKDFTLKSVVKDSTYTLSEMKDKVVLINFWATWCGPCRMEIPDFNELYNKYSSQGFEILSVSISDTKDQLLNFLKAYNIDYPILYGKQADMQKIIVDYGGVYSIPMSFLIGKNNEIKRVYPGAILKQYDPNMYTDLIYTIESSLAENNIQNSNIK